MSFKESISHKEGYHTEDAPVYHIVPYITGGLDTLISRIKTESVPELSEYGYHTNEEGHFEPVGECLMGLRYLVKQKLDTKGHSAVLVLAEDLFDHKKLVVIKVLHSHFYRLGLQETHILRKLALADPLNHSHTLRLLTTLTFDSHFCMVFEPLLPEPLTRIFQEFPSHRVLPNLRKVGLRLLTTIGFLHQQNMIHTDLKPENILLKHESDLDSVHIVDFGNTVNYVHKEVSLYYNDFELQTPLYRAPEVMFGLPFGTEIDMWSLGCILAELYTGEPLFFGTNKEEILKQMIKLLGPFPAAVFKRGKFYHDLLQYTSVEDKPKQVSATTALIDHLQCRDVAFVELLAGLLCYNPDERLTAREAACYPFFASHFPVGFLMENSTSGVSSFSTKHISSKNYFYSPHISPSIKKRQPSSQDLLKLGTTECSPNKSYSGIVRPKPIELLNERRKLLTRKSDDQLDTSDKSSVGISGKYIDALTKAKDENKFSDKVKEKMSSLLKAIKEEQNLVETDLERKSDENTMKENCKRDSSAVKTYLLKLSDGGLKMNRNDIGETKNKILSPGHDAGKDVVNDTKYKKQRLLYDGEYNEAPQRKQSPCSENISDRFNTELYKSTFNPKTNMKRLKESKEKILHKEIESSYLRRNERSEKLSASGSSDFNVRKRISDEFTHSELSEIDIDGAMDSDNSARKYRSGLQRQRPPCQNASRNSHTGEESELHLDISSKFEQFSDAVTPKHTKHHSVSLDADEYVDIISPFNAPSDLKRHKSAIHDEDKDASKTNVKSPRFQPVKPKAVVKPDSWRHYQYPLNVSDYNFENNNKTSSGTDNTSNSVEVEAVVDLTNYHEKEIDFRRPDLADNTNKSAVGKSLSKSSSNVKSLMQDEIHLLEKRDSARKRKSSEFEAQSAMKYRTEPEPFGSNKSHSSINDDHEKLEQTSDAVDSVQTRQYQPHEAVSNRTTLQHKHARHFSEEKHRSHKHEAYNKTKNYLTPIPKTDNHLNVVNVHESPEIIYKVKQQGYNDNDGGGWQASHSSQVSSTGNDEYGSEKRGPKQRIFIEGRHDKPWLPNFNNKSSDFMESKANKMASGSGKSNKLPDVNKMGSSFNTEDPFEFSGTPGTDTRKMKVQGIGERIEQKRNKVKKKARKSLTFEQNFEDDSCESDSSSQTVHSQYESDTRQNKSEDNSVGNSRNEKSLSQVKQNTVQERQNRARKRLLSDDIRVTPTGYSKAGKKLKSDILKQSDHEAVNRVVKKPNLSKAFDTTYTVESFRERNIRGVFK